MMEMNRFLLALKALRELGPGQLGLYVLYQLGLRSGHYRRVTSDQRPVISDRATATRISPYELQSGLMILPSRDELNAVLGDQGKRQILNEAEEILAGWVRLFGGEPVRLRLDLQGPLVHWTEYELGRVEKAQQGVNELDVKFIWEPARFGWAYTLCRAYWLSGDERYAAAFWKNAELFLEANPPYLGQHWVSAQEAALRLMAFVFAAHVFGDSPHSTPERMVGLGRAIANHAARIPPTLVYGRAQNNNHLLSEAAGLFTAGVALPDHPEARRWRKMGWYWFNQGLETQVAEDGAYVQHSANYHRLVLQLALWVNMLPQQLQPGTAAPCFPVTSQRRLAAATRWLAALLDPESGRLPNLGPNDGAYILPLTICPFSDYRPVVQAAAMAFLGERFLAGGPWDEMALWLKSAACRTQDELRTPYHVLRNSLADSWAYLRAARFTSRPGHADQLHLDMWWCGLNVAQDAGTYLYNGPPPWDNALACTEVHNTLTINGQDQMTRTGRFLYLDWAQAVILPSNSSFSKTREKVGELNAPTPILEEEVGASLVAQHDGYRRLGAIHRRAVAAIIEGWTVEDTILPAKTSWIVRPSLAKRSPAHDICLHWLLPDWPWEITGGVRSTEHGARNTIYEIRLMSPLGPIILGLSSAHPSQLQVVRAG
jgi:hypothetical protein